MNVFRKIMVFAIIGLFLGAGVVPSMSMNAQNAGEVEIPLWKVGDSWTYDLTINGGIDATLELNNVRCSNLHFVVTSVFSDRYKLDITADISGYVGFKLDLFSLSGRIQDAGVSAVAYVDRSTLAFTTVEDLAIIGYVKPNIGPRVRFELQGSVVFSNFNSAFAFPISDGKNWSVPEAKITLDASVVVLGQTIPIDDFSLYVEAHDAEVVGFEDVSIGGIDFPSFQISKDLGHRHDVWYCPMVGNVVKIISRGVPLSWGGHGYYDISMELVSTTYPDPPDSPSAPVGPSTVDAGDTCDYSTVATDPGNNNIRYIFDWGDGTSSTSVFVSSGEEITLSHQWNTGGVFDLRVQAQNIFGAVSDWSSPLTVTVLNEPPGKPLRPSGPTEGKIGQTYSFATSSTDPEGHRIRYGWDWNGDTYVDHWTRYFSSGETASASYVWNDQGTYNIRVKAMDEHGGESDWSDPLSVTMPKTRSYGFFSSMVFSLLSLQIPLMQRFIDFFDSFDILFSNLGVRNGWNGEEDESFGENNICLDDTGSMEPVDFVMGEKSLSTTFHDNVTGFVDSVEGNGENSLNTNGVMITSPNNGQVVSGTVYISWIFDYDPDFMESHHFDVYCGGYLVAQRISGYGGTGSYYWNSLSVSDGPCVIKVDYFRINAIFEETFVGSDSVQVIVKNSPESWVSVISPNGGERYEDEDEIKIRWSLYYPYDCLPLFDIYYQKQGQSWVRVLHNAESPISEGNVYWMWDISEIQDGAYKIRIDMKHCGGGGVVASDTSDNWFYIESSQPPPANPDLSCSGSLGWSGVSPGSLVTGSFRVRNIGDSGSLLNWRIESYPGWGDWTFTPSSGSGLTPEDGDVVVEVTVRAPEVRDATFSGDVLVMNSDDSSDYERVVVSLATPRNRGFTSVFGRFFENLLFLFLFLGQMVLCNGGEEV